MAPSGSEGAQSNVLPGFGPAPRVASSARHRDVAGVGEFGVAISGGVWVAAGAQTPRVLRGLDGWLRRRLRALLLKQWRHARRIYAELCRLGVSQSLAARVASCAGRWWHMSRQTVHGALTVAYFDELGVPRFS